MCAAWLGSGVGMGLPRHDGEVVGAVAKWNAVLIPGIRGRARAHAMLRGRHHCVPRVSQGGLLRHEELLDFLDPARTFFHSHTSPSGTSPPAMH